MNLDILKKRTTDMDLKKEAVELLAQAGCFEYTIKYLREIKKDIFTELEFFNGNAHLEKMLVDLCKILD
jgi:hypothetical protein